MLEQFFSIDQKLLALAKQAEQEAKPAFDRIDEIAAHNEAKVLKAFIDNHVSESHFVGSTGYGLSLIHI